MLNVGTILVLAVFLYGCANAISGPGPLCMSCDKVVRPRDCTHVTLCGEHEKCSVEMYISTSGVQFYRVGCKATKLCEAHRRRRSVSGDTMVCLECCNDEKLCNRKGCGESDFEVSGSKICYKCDQHLNPDTCEDIAICGQDQDCFISDMSIVTDKLYTSGCMSKQMCNRTHGNNACFHCCNTPLCNEKCEETTSVTATTTHPTTTYVKTSTVTRGHTVPLQTTANSHTVLLQTTANSHTVPLQTTANTGLFPSCPAGHWYTFQNSKYCLYNIVANWYVASALCKKYSTHLPIVETQEELGFIYSIIRPHYQTIWLDGTDESVDGQWIWSTTGKAINHTMWLPGQPDNFFGQHSENCLEYGSAVQYKWNDELCLAPRTVLCEWSTESTAESIPDCSSGWKIEQSYMFCYVDRHTSWYEAKTECLRHGAHLPIIDSAGKQSLMDTLVNNKETVWLDGTKEGDLLHWKWNSTGVNIRYTNWQPGEPNSYHHSQENCIEYGKARNMQWNDISCKSTTITTKILCEKSTSSVILG